MSTNRPSDRTAVRSKEEAQIRAYDALDDADCVSIVTSMPHRTRGTWVVPATTERSNWRVHIDSKTGQTRVVRVPA